AGGEETAVLQHEAAAHRRNQSGPVRLRGAAPGFAERRGRHARLQRIRQACGLPELRARRGPGSPIVTPTHPVPLSAAQARALWLHAQRLETRAPFGNDAGATLAAIEHLGYV